MRVQEYIVRSGRYHLSAQSFDNIRSALVEMKVRIRREMIDIKDSAVRTNYDDTFTIVDGKERPMRVFTLVAKRKGDSIPFGHLLAGKNAAAPMVVD